jgi:hypothetical protein
MLSVQLSDRNARSKLPASNQCRDILHLRLAAIDSPSTECSSGIGGEMTAIGCFLRWVRVRAIGFGFNGSSQRLRPLELSTSGFFQSTAPQFLYSVIIWYLILVGDRFQIVITKQPRLI